MGRRPLAARTDEKAHSQRQPQPLLHENGVAISPMKRVESLPETTNPLGEQTVLQPQSLENNPSSDKANSQPLLTKKKAKTTYLKKKSKKNNIVVRRSERIQNVIVSPRSCVLDPIIEEISGSKNDEAELPSQQEKHLADSESDQSSGEKKEEKVDYLVKLYEGQEKIMKALKFKETMNELPSSPNVRYKNLYIDSQKKIEALKNENQQLAQKLEAALSKLEGYEKGTQDFAEVLVKLKDVILVSNISKVTETAVNVSSQAIQHGMSPRTVRQTKNSTPKRRKTAKGNE